VGDPTSEVGYTATTRRGDHGVYMDMWWYWKKEYSQSQEEVLTFEIHSSKMTQLKIRADTHWHKQITSIPLYAANFTVPA
jgi:hypothetical protein